MTERAIISHKITLGSQSFNIRIHPEEREYYDKIAAFTEQFYEDIYGQGVVGGATQVWAMTAFQIAIELFEIRQAAGMAEGDRQTRLQKLVERIESVINDEG